jgi:hypothetical protein
LNLRPADYEKQKSLFSNSATECHQSLEAAIDAGLSGFVAFSCLRPRDTKIVPILICLGHKNGHNHTSGALAVSSVQELAFGLPI